jgi:hypothetical protein
LLEGVARGVSGCVTIVVRPEGKTHVPPSNVSEGGAIRAVSVEDEGLKVA